MRAEHTNEPSDEVDERQLELAREEGERYQRSVEYMATEVAESGATARAGEYLVGVAQEHAEGLYRMVDDHFTWQEPSADENCHLEVMVADATDGRFLPHLDVHATIEDGGDTEFGPEPIPFVWHPGVHHYGRNLELPGDGNYTVVVDIEPAAFRRHDRTNGDRYTEPVEVRVEGLPFATGRK